MIVVVGSLNPTKVGAAETVFKQAWPSCTVRGEGVQLPVSIGPMPIGEQVRAGARVRAQTVLVAGVDYGVGLEGGIEFDGDRAYLFNWCAVTMPSGAMLESPSPRLLLPQAFADAVRHGEELGPYAAALAQEPELNRRAGVVGLLTRGLLHRQAFFEQALICALAPRLAPHLYGLTGKE